MSFTPRGIITPIITPFTREGRINEPVLRQIIDFLVGGGIHGILPLGTTGEFYGVDEDDYRRILEITVEQTNGRVPVYAGANHITTRGTIKLIKIAEKTGVDAITVLTPMFISQTQEELYMFFKTVAESTGLPVVMYNNKPKTNVTIEPETVARLAAIENIVGIKDSTGDFTNTAEYIRLTRHMDRFSVLIGRDTLIHAALCYGASGAIASCANVAPRLTADIYDKYVAGDIMGSLEAQFKLAPLRLAFNLGSFPEVIKEALAMQGFDVGKSLDPIAELAPDKKEELRSLLKDMGIIS
jgi:4-hydroxy-tetrahydrodipicolinate synthase